MQAKLQTGLQTGLQAELQAELQINWHWVEPCKHNIKVHPKLTLSTLLFPYRFIAQSPCSEDFCSSYGAVQEPASNCQCICSSGHPTLSLSTGACLSHIEGKNDSCSLACHWAYPGNMCIKIVFSLWGLCSLIQRIGRAHKWNSWSIAICLSYQYNPYQFEFASSVGGANFTTKLVCSYQETTTLLLKWWDGKSVI